MKTKRKLPEFGLLFSLNRDGTYFHPRLSAVVLQGDDKVRFASEFGSGIEHLAYIVLTGQGGSYEPRDVHADVYCWEVIYDCRANVDNVTQAKKALDAIAKRMKEIVAQDGTADNFGRYAIRFARAVGASFIVFQLAANERGYYTQVSFPVAMARINKIIGDTLRDMGYTSAA